MMWFSKETAVNLYRVLANENEFAYAVATEVEAGRLTRKDAERTILMYYDNHIKLMNDLSHGRP